MPAEPERSPMTPRVDYHAHSNYSDGSLLFRMAAAADAAGLEAFGFADHCNAGARDEARRTRELLGFNLDRTYERRRRAIDRLNDRYDVRLLDGVEMDYVPRDEDAVRAFLDEAGFDYAVGSVHSVDGHNVQQAEPFAEMSVAERESAVETYFDRLVALVESELFDVAAHLDVVERNPPLRGLATPADYERVADALAASRTVTEVNAGRVHEAYGAFHPSPAFLEMLLERDVTVVAGTDAHAPDEVEPRLNALGTLAADRDLAFGALDVR